MSKIKKWLLLPGQERWEFFQIFFLTGLVRLAVLCLPFRWIAHFLGEQGVESGQKLTPAQRVICLRISRIILWASKHTPWESKCLVQGITGKILLRRKGISNTLYLGVNKPETVEEMAAHAWLRAGNMIITGNQGWNDYLSLSSFGEERITRG
ncbi:MAG: lasso peptide biosynthesis B2 protein [Bacillota bacterium]|jgi:hypothetical protein